VHVPSLRPPYSLSIAAMPVSVVAASQLAQSSRVEVKYR
jgi:hypothetical protein